MKTLRKSGFYGDFSDFPIFFNGFIPMKYPVNLRDELIMGFQWISVVENG